MAMGLGRGAAGIGSGSRNGLSRAQHIGARARRPYASDQQCGTDQRQPDQEAEQPDQRAGELFLSHETVKAHVAHMLAKLQLRDRVQAVVLAYESGLVVPGEG